MIPGHDLYVIVILQSTKSTAVLGRLCLAWAVTCENVHAVSLASSPPICHCGPRGGPLVDALNASITPHHLVVGITSMLRSLHMCTMTSLQQVMFCAVCCPCVALLHSRSASADDARHQRFRSLRKLSATCAAWGSKYCIQYCSATLVQPCRVG